jgi:hypothetical protein
VAFCAWNEEGVGALPFRRKERGALRHGKENNAMKELLARLVLLLFIVGITKGVVEDKNPTAAKPPGGGARQAEDFQPSR